MLFKSYFDQLIRLSINDRVKTEAIKIRRQNTERLLDAIMRQLQKYMTFCLSVLMQILIELKISNT